MLQSAQVSSVDQTALTGSCQCKCSGAHLRRSQQCPDTCAHSGQHPKLSRHSRPRPKGAKSFTNINRQGQEATAGGLATCRHSRPQVSRCPLHSCPEKQNSSTGVQACLHSAREVATPWATDWYREVHRQKDMQSSVHPPHCPIRKVASNVSHDSQGITRHSPHVKGLARNVTWKQTGCLEAGHTRI